MTDFFGKHVFTNTWNKKLTLALNSRGKVYNQVKKHLKFANVMKNIQNYNFVDIGFGQQAISILKLGAKKVINFDVSKTNYKNLKNFINKNQIKDLINKNINIEKKNHFQINLINFIYMHGVLQHLDNPSLGLINLSRLQPVSGKFWISYYRPESDKWFIIYLLRKIAKKKDIKFYKSKNNKFNETLLRYFIDDMYVKNMNFYSKENLIKFYTNIGYIFKKQFYYYNKYRTPYISHLMFEKKIEKKYLNKIKLKPENIMNHMNENRIKILNTFTKNFELLLKNKKRRQIIENIYQKTNLYNNPKKK